MYYELHGNPKNPSLVLVSGLKADHSNWDNILQQLTQQFYVLIFDNHGVGKNQKNLMPCTIETMADDLYILIDKLKLNTPHLLGHSMGGAIAQQFTYKYPYKIDKLILCNSFMRFNTVSKIAFESFLDLHHATFSPGKIMKAIVPWGFSASFLDRNPSLLERIITTSDRSLFPQSAEGYHAQLQALCTFDSRSIVSHIKSKTLIIASKEDIIAPLNESEILAETIAHSKLVVLPGGHASYIEAPEYFLHEIQLFLEPK